MGGADVDDGIAGGGEPISGSFIACCAQHSNHTTSKLEMVVVSLWRLRHNGGSNLLRGWSKQQSSHHDVLNLRWSVVN